MFTGQILGGDWGRGWLELKDMPKDFVLSARKLVVMEEDEYAELAAARKKPEPGEFTKELRDCVSRSFYRNCDDFEILYDDEDVLEACDIIDRLTEENKNVLDANVKCAQGIFGLEDTIARLTAENAKQKELIEYVVSQDKQFTKGTLALEAEIKAKDELLKELVSANPRLSGD